MKIFISILFFVTCIAHKFASSVATDTLMLNQTLTDINNEILVSANERFELGFFRPGNSTKSYLGIWFKNIAEQTVVWVANKDSPLSDSYGVVTITEDGKIVVFDNKTGNSVWSSNSSTASAAAKPTLQLLDTGNLVVKVTDNQENSYSYIWQSFDYPCDTLLPGMKQGWNLVTGQNWYLTSWRSLQDPSTGDFTYKLDFPYGLPQLHLFKGSSMWYRSGPWDGNGFGGGPKMKDIPIFKPIFIYNATYIYYAFENSDDSIISRFVLGPSGLLQHLTWSQKRNCWSTTFVLPSWACDSFAICGPNGICNENKAPPCQCPTKFMPKVPEDWRMMDWTGGCVRRTPLNSSQDHGFMKLSMLKLPDNSCNMSNMTKEDGFSCADACLNNSICTAYAVTEIISCVMWFGDLLDIRDYTEGGQELYVRLVASEIGLNSKDGRELIICLTTIPVMASLLMWIGIFITWKKKSSRRICLNLNNQNEDSIPSLMEKGLELPLFDMFTVAAATNNFSPLNKVGEGGFGPVYKGKLSSGQEIAVKALSKNSGQGIKEFKNEVILIAKLQHRNLVRLLGYGDERMLVYEYMPNGSLDSYLFDQTRGISLNWQQQFNIIVGIARGLLYLHRDSRLRIIHRDLKASNILLDADMNPKISDFGLARMLGGEQTEAKTCRVMGTYGYMSPEYAIDGQFSVKSDVYSFGVLVLEIVSNQRNREFYHPDHDLNLLGHAWKLWNEGRAIELLMGTSTEGQLNTTQVLKCIQIGLLCVQQNPEDRPTMSSIMLMLDLDNPLLPQPEKPGYYTDRCILPNRKQPNYTVTDFTLTKLQGR